MNKFYKIRNLKFSKNCNLEIRNLAVINTAFAGVITDAPHISVVLFNILQFLLSVFGFLAIIGIVFSGIFYLTAAGNERQLFLARKSFLYSIIGIVIALSGLVIINFLSERLK